MAERHDWFITWSGRRVFVTEPDPAQIAIEDIAHALSHLCRFNGHVRAFYSVGQHSVLVSRIVPREDALVGLLHDATEAYLGDVIRPLKRELKPRYHDLEVMWERAICTRFGLDRLPSRSSAVKEADMVALATERRDLINPTARRDFGGQWIEDEAGVRPHPETILPLPPAQARALFLERWEEVPRG